MQNCVNNNLNHAANLGLYNTNKRTKSGQLSTLNPSTADPVTTLHFAIPV